MTSNDQKVDGLRPLLSIVITHFWFKCFGTLGFIAIFFSGYIYLLKNPVGLVMTMPVIFIDELVGFEPFALPAYLSLWAYVSMPPILMRTPGQIIEYGFWIGGLCLVALGIFYIWPTAVPPANIDWAAYPGMAFLKGVDAAGNACPSLHVATAVFSGIILDRIFVTLGMGGGYRLFNGAWCLAIVYSTIATKQHVAVDVFAGGAFGCLCAPLALNKGLNFLRITRQN